MDDWETIWNYSNLSILCGMINPNVSSLSAKGGNPKQTNKQKKKQEMFQFQAMYLNSKREFRT